MTGIVFALGAALGWGVADFLGGRTSRAAAALAVLAVSQAIGVLVVAVAAAVVGLGPPSAEGLLWAAGSGAALTLGLGALYQAMAVGAMAVASPIAATGSVIPVAVGLASGDRPSAVQSVGVAAALVGVVLCSREEGPLRLAGDGLARGFGLAVLAAIGGGLTATALGKASTTGVLWVLLVQRTTVALLAFAVARFSGASLRLGRAAIGPVAAIGVVDLVATGLFTAAATHAELSLIAVVGALYPVVTVGLAFTVLSERLAGHQALGAAMALAGTAAIAGG